ncbi:MAG: Tm-1-like ATP-binding domain-containing protein [Dermatophilaceae bacterium]
MTEKTVLLMANLDTRGSEFVAFKDLIAESGLHPLLLDFSMEQEPSAVGDIRCEEVARAGGLDIETVRAAYPVERKIATDCMIRGARAIVGRLFEEGRIHGVIGAGGATSTLICTSAWRALPFGFPKVMATSIASHPRYVENCVGTRDITMHHTVVDVMGSNALLDCQLRNAVAAVCGMAHAYEPGACTQTKPVIAVTSFGFAERCVEPALALLRGRGFESVPFHAQGRGDRALDELIREGAIAGVLDVTPRGLAESLLGGNGAAGSDRVKAAAEMGVPQVVAPSGFDMIAVGGQAGWEEHYAGRAFAVIDELRVMVRTTAEECRSIARELAVRLNASRSPYLFLLPLRGWSSLDKEGGALYDPLADAAFHEELAHHLERPERIRTVDANLYSAEFGAACVEAFMEVWHERGVQVSAVLATLGAGTVPEQTDS